MSYDLHIFGDSIDADALRAAIVTGDLAIEPQEGATRLLTVVRGARRRYCFTVALPHPVEPEDIPEEIGAVLLGATSVVEILVEGSADSEIPYAIRAARRVAGVMGGAVLDPQTDEVFARGRSRVASPVQRGTISVIDVTWYLRSATVDPRREASAFVAAARRHLPEALPRRYGRTEPLQERWDSGGEAAFLSYVASEPDTVFTRGTLPVEGAILGVPGRDSTAYRHSMTLLLEPLRDPRWRAALERMFIELANSCDAIFASVEVLRGVEWSGRSLGFRWSTEQTTFLGGKGWKGLPPYPVWMAWFGRDYGPLVRERLDWGTVTEFGDRLLFRADDAILDRDELRGRLTTPAPPRRWFDVFRRAAEPVESPWVPREYLAVPVERGNRWSVPPEPAPVVPEALRG